MSTLLAAFGTSAALAQMEPTSPVRIAINGVFFLCPALTQGKPAPDSAGLAKLGFAPADPAKQSELTFAALSKQGVLQVRYDPTAKQCFLEYGGPGYEQIAGVVRDTVARNRFTRITGGDRDGAKADVFEGRVPDRPATARIIIIENYTQPSATIRYTEKADS